MYEGEFFRLRFRGFEEKRRVAVVLLLLTRLPHPLSPSSSVARSRTALQVGSYIFFELSRIFHRSLYLADNDQPSVSSFSRASTTTLDRKGPLGSKPLPSALLPSQDPLLSNYVLDLLRYRSVAFHRRVEVRKNPSSSVFSLSCLVLPASFKERREET